MKGGVLHSTQVMTALSNSHQVYEFIKSSFHPRQEELWLIALSPSLEVLASEMIFRGTVNSCLTHPREIFRFLVLQSATSFLMAHNHPTGLALPSRADLIVTRKIWKLGQIMEIPLNDHLILGEGGYASLADRGFFKNMKG